MNEITQSAASAAEEMSSATEHLSGMAQDLQRLMGQFRLGDGADHLAMASAQAGNGNGNGNGHGNGNGKREMTREAAAG